MAYYADLREYINVLEKEGKLVRFSQPVNKDTELMPLFRWQYRGLQEKERKAFLFENVYDSRGKKYSIPVLVGALAASKEVYALGMQCEQSEIVNKWANIQKNPIPPRVVQSGPVQDVVIQGEELHKEGSGLDLFPIPISTPGFDSAPFFALAHWVTKDPDTGEYNMGNYRGQVKSPTRIGAYFHPTQHAHIHWEKCRERGIPLEAALVVGSAPNISYTAITKIPFGVDEYGIAGAIAGAPLDVVQCKTVDLLVPATAEIVFEGKISTEYREPEGPFGEYTGYMGAKTMSPYFDITAITHRKDPIFQTILSQHTPSEASAMSHVAREVVFYKFLRYDCNIPAVQEVVFQETGGNWQYVVIRLKKSNPSDPWQALRAASAYDSTTGKIIIAVDEDINPHDPEMVNWAMSYRMQPAEDTQIIKGKASMLDPSVEKPHIGYKEQTVYGASAILIDATRKWPYLPVSLPKQEFMERAKELWEGAGLPELKPKDPWHGYHLGYWTDEDEEEARLAVEGKYYETGKKAVGKRVSIKDADK